MVKKASTFRVSIVLIDCCTIIICAAHQVVTYEVAVGMEQCRLACGGHGYSLASGFPELYGLTVGACTYEGDNIVMLLQVARLVLSLLNLHECAVCTLASSSKQH